MPCAIGQRAAVHAVEAVGRRVAGDAARAADARDERDLVRRPADGRQRAVDRLHDAEVAAARAPDRLEVALVVLRLVLLDGTRRWCSWSSLPGLACSPPAPRSATRWSLERRGTICRAAARRSRRGGIGFDPLRRQRLRRPPARPRTSAGSGRAAPGATARPRARACTTRRTPRRPPRPPGRAASARAASRGGPRARASSSASRATPATLPQVTSAERRVRVALDARTGRGGASAGRACGSASRSCARASRRSRSGRPCSLCSMPEAR